jgi:hypothetical protein
MPLYCPLDKRERGYGDAERMSSTPKGRVTFFFFTDIQGSTRLWERDAKKMQRDGLALWANQKNRLIVLEAVDGETVIIAVAGPAQEFAEFWPKAQGLLDTMEWGAAS